MSSAFPDWDFEDIDDVLDNVSSEHLAATQPALPQTPPPTEVVDLTSSPQEILKQRKRKRSEEESVAVSQQPITQQTTTTTTRTAAQQGTRIGKMTCIICMEHYTNATIAACGHIYCHECLTRALMASERNSSGSCPSCRKPISRRKVNQIIPVNFMKKSAYEARAG